jgi:hypothetical protein
MMDQRDSVTGFFDCSRRRKIQRKEKKKNNPGSISAQEHYFAPPLIPLVNSHNVFSNPFAAPLSRWTLTYTLCNADVEI